MQTSTAHPTSLEVYGSTLPPTNINRELDVIGSRVALREGAGMPQIIDQSATWQQEHQLAVLPVEVEIPSEEAAICSRVVQLWTEQKQQRSAVKRTRAELEAVRVALGAELFELKGRHARTGRGGGWMAFLNQIGIPRTSADRFVELHRRLLSKDEKRTSGALSEPTAEEVSMYARVMAPRLRQKLVKYAAVVQFLEEIRLLLQPSDASDDLPA